MRSAIDGNYCATEALERDPLMANLRATPTYAALREKAADCQERALAGRGR